MTGKVGPYSIGLVDIQTDRLPAFGVAGTNFAVTRVKRDVLRRSSVGLLLARRSVSLDAAGPNHTVGVDGVFAFHENLNVNTYLAKASTRAQAGDDLSYRAQLDYNADRYGLQLEHLFVDEAFNPEVGFLRRAAFRRSSAFVRFSPRPRSVPRVRKFHYDAKIDYVTDTDGRLESRQAQGTARVEFQQDVAEVQYVRNFEFLDEPFDLTSDRAVAPGRYNFSEVQLAYTFGPQRPVSGSVELVRGAFYGGTRTGINVSRGRVEFTPAITLEPIVSFNRIQLPEATVTTALVAGRGTYALSPRAAASALVQYNSTTHSLSGSIRFRWEYEPGSDLFIVFTDLRDTYGPGRAQLQGRGVVVKLTRLIRF